MKYLLICIALLAVIISCDDTTAPEQPAGYFSVDSIFATIVVESNDQDQIISTVNVRYVYHFEESQGYVKIRRIAAPLQDQDKVYVLLDTFPHAANQLHEDIFRYSIAADYSHYSSAKLSITLRGYFSGGGCIYSPGEECKFEWKGDILAEVENRLE